MSQLLAKRYAQALFEKAQQDKATDSIMKDFDQIHHVMESVPGFVNFLKNPIIPTQKKQDILNKIFKGKVHPLTLQFIFFLEKKKRLFLLKSLRLVFEQLYFDAKGIVKAHIRSAIALNTSQLQAIKHHLKLKCKKDIEADSLIDPSLVGGFKIQVGDKIFDFSIKRLLEMFKENSIVA